MEVNVDIDDETDLTLNAEKDQEETIVINKRDKALHNMKKLDDHEENMDDSDDNNSKKQHGPESNTTPSSLSNSADKHRRKNRKQDMIKEKYQ